MNDLASVSPYRLSPAIPTPAPRTSWPRLVWWYVRGGARRLRGAHDRRAGRPLDAICVVWGPFTAFRLAFANAPDWFEAATRAERGEIAEWLAQLARTATAP